MEGQEDKKVMEEEGEEVENLIVGGHNLIIIQIQVDIQGLYTKHN